jgi:hypothetical protein
MMILAQSISSNNLFRWGPSCIPICHKNRSVYLLELYLYIVVSLIVRVFSSYFTPVYVLYIVAFSPYGIQLIYS